MKVFYSDRYVIPLPPNHRFPISKYAAIRQQLDSEGTVRRGHVFPPGLIDRDEALSVHTGDYYDRLASGSLSAAEIRRLGLPWSELLVQRSRASVAGTLAAARAALEDGIGVNLGGGTHHAFSDHGEGFCVFNDIAVAISVLRNEGLIDRALVIDLDVHQGNGTAAIFSDEPNVFTLSLHGEKNYPLIKQQSSLDVGLADETDDDSYLEVLALHLPAIFDRFRPDIVFYQAGVDPFFDDKLGRLALTLEGLRRRDEFVLKSCRVRFVSCVITLGGGYARRLEDTVEAHCNTVRAADAIFGVRSA
jgi:acetoin utilization deacetylase AcuC-like enzyme